MEPVHLHSKHLFHFKRDIEVVKLILADGFRHNSWNETIPFFGLTQKNFMVCFTDLRHQDSSQHRNCYGKNAIVMSKAWAVKNRISPVRYIHKFSPGMNEEYMSLKNLYRNAMLHEYNLHKVISYFITADMYCEDELPQGDISLLNQWNPALIDVFQERCEKLERMFSLNQDFEEYMFVALKMINKLHHELELRDAYLRTYIGDFEPCSGSIIKDKVLYDEKEWRSIVFPDINAVNDSHTLQCINQGYLPNQYNLKFTNDDLIAILVENSQDKDDLINFILNSETMLKKDSSKKVLLYDEYDHENYQSDASSLIGEYHRINLSR